MLDVLPPPPTWIADPPQTMIELRLPRSRLNVLCRLIGGDPGFQYRDLYGCSLWAIGGCLIVVPSVDAVITAKTQADIRAHEVAHCNGWPGNHPLTLSPK